MDWVRVQHLNVLCRLAALGDDDLMGIWGPASRALS
jgi:hypothetical protein